MRLRHQLLIVSLLVLTLPWAAGQFIRELELALQQGQQQTLDASLNAISAVILDQPELFGSDPESYHAANDPRSLYLHRRDHPNIIDGYDEDWLQPAQVFHSHDNPELSMRYRGSIYQQSVALFIEVRGSQSQYFNPTLSALDNGDRLVLITGNDRRYVINSSSPGDVHGRYWQAGHVNDQDDIYGRWIDTQHGFNIELTLPLALLQQKLGLLLIDEQSDGRQYQLGNVTQHSPTAPRIIYPLSTLIETLNIFNNDDIRYLISDRQQWVIGYNQDPRLDNDSPTHYQSSATDDSHWLLRKLYRALLNPLSNYLQDDWLDGKFSSPENINALNGQAGHRWYRLANSQQKLLSSAKPLVVDGQVVGTIIAQQSSERTLSLTDSAFSKLFEHTLLAITLTLGGIIGYAAWLSRRIRRLSKSAERRVDANGVFVEQQQQLPLPNSRSRDEIGDLARSYQQLFDRLQQYTDYLRTLSRKLSHELRTPLAIIHSSLDNLEQTALNEDARCYQQRAKDGALRLSHIITAMSEATRVEDSIQQAEPEQVDLNELLYHVGHAYRDLYPQHRIELAGIELDNSPQLALVVPELIVQMLDKLFDNAAGFCPEGGCITLRYYPSNSEHRLSVDNDGPLLPQQLQHQLFDNMVTLRQSKGDDGHLGLGLHIVKLIVDFHQGSVRAFNRADNAGVCFDIRWPR
ncbi:dedicated sortase system histidine kinase [Sinobacterium caligoides]|uniref:histidine kinase n=1 Tax=Sinobacterium caligoides TaxID=933926 RepID=A0A3N2DQ17_9GAMM|nr:ATP-binding protein [Sinobacterium caligoides]ROS01883.1 dedicated sortase system histidine kinase [Sinobacterium caligoides]